MTPEIAALIEQFCRDLNAAHDEILRLQNCSPDKFSDYDWPEWSAPANSIRHAEELLGKPLSKRSLRNLTEAGKVKETNYSPPAS